MTSLNREQRSRLLDILMRRFSESELRRLCFRINVDGLDYENLRGEGKADKARELIDFLQRRQQTHKLVEVGRERRPDIPWDHLLRTNTYERDIRRLHSYEEQFREAEELIRENEERLSELKQEERQLEESHRELRAQVAREKEQLDQKRTEISTIQADLEALRESQELLQALIPIYQDRESIELADLTVELRRIYFSRPSSEDIPSVLIPLYDSIRDELLDSHIELAKEYEEGGDVDRAVSELVKAERLCGESQRRDLQPIQQRLAYLQEERGERSGSVRHYQHAADLWRSLEDFRPLEAVLVKIARLQEDERRYSRALRTYCERLSLLVLIGKENEIQTCLTDIADLGARYEQDRGTLSAYERDAYEWAIEHYSKQESIEHLENLSQLAYRRGLTEVGDKARRYRSRLESLGVQTQE